MIFSDLSENIHSDLFRYYANSSFKTLIKGILTNGGFQISFFYRLSQYLLRKRIVPLSIITKLFLKFFCIIYNSELHTSTQIGKGIYLSHCTGIIISGYAVIGRYVNISQQVTIGISGRGDKRGVPQIGNYVYIGPGAKLFGNIKIGNNVAIGANAVVTKDVPDNCVVVGVPAKVISQGGSREYILNTGCNEETVQ